MTAGAKVAVLDDYQEVSKPHFDRLRHAGYEVTIFTDTLLPYNHPDTPQDAKDALVNRLKPFSIICESLAKQSRILTLFSPLSGRKGKGKRKEF
jgi:hypothetical protein